jgi:hypothetical protein
MINLASISITQPQQGVWLAHDLVSDTMAASTPQGFQVRPGDQPSGELVRVFAWMLGTTAGIERFVLDGHQSKLKA